MIEAEIAAEKEKSEQGFRRTEAAVLAHGVVDPIARACVPQDSASIAEQESLSRRGWTESDGAGDLEFARGPGTQQSEDKRCKRKPGENINAGQRKDDDLQNRR